MKRRRLLSLLLCAAMLCTLLGAPALADEGTPAGTEETTSVGNNEAPSGGSTVEEKTSEGVSGSTDTSGEGTGKKDGAQVDAPETDANDEDEEDNGSTNQGTGSGLENGDAVVPGDDDNSDGNGENTDNIDGDSTDDVDGAGGQTGDTEDEGENTGDDIDEAGGTTDGDEDPDANEQDSDDEQTEVGEGEEQTEVGDEELADAMMLSLEDELMLTALDAIKESPVVHLSLSGHVHSATACCPGGTVTISSNATIDKVVFSGPSSVTVSVNGNSCSQVFNASGDYTAEVSFTDPEFRNETKSFRITHGSLQLDTQKISEPTCTQSGQALSIFRCGSCWALLGKRASSDNGDPTGHDYENQPIETIDLGKGCGEGTVKVQYCKKCNAMKVVEGSLGTAEQHLYKPVTEEPTCHTVGKKYERCERCGAINPEDGKYEVIPTDPQKHQWGAWDIPQDSLVCGKKVTATRKCEVEGCDATDSFTYESNAQHKFDKWVPTKEATCQEAGREDLVCSVCETRKTGSYRTIPKLSHDWQQDPDKENKPADCVNDGVEYRYCTMCNSTDEVTVPAFGHTPDTAKGYEISSEGHWHVCSVCGQPTSEPVAHAYAIKNCEVGEVCSVCGYVKEDSKREHQWKWTTRAKYTHTGTCEICGTRSNGEEHILSETDDCRQPRTCLKCGYERSGFSSHYAIGAWIDGKFVVGACKVSEDKQTHYQECMNSPDCTYRKTMQHNISNHDCTAGDIKCNSCGAVFTTQQSEHAFAKPAHFDGQASTVACTNPGCTATTTIVHNLEDREQIINDATCTTPGKKIVYQVCTGGCGYETEPQEVEIAALGHDMTEYEDFQPATCQNAGMRKRHCKRCGLEETENVDPSAHPGKVLKVLQAPDCTNEGSQAMVCTVCGAELEPAVTIPALGHQMVDDHVVTPEGCKTDRVVFRKCARDGCAFSEEVTIPGTALGHNFENYVYQADATCLEDGHEKATCSRCEDVDVRVKVGSKLEHVFENDNDCTTPGKCIFGCGTESEAFEAHLPCGVWVVDPVNDTHAMLCGREGCEQLAVKPQKHTPAEDDGDCTTPILCTVCGAEDEPANVEHDFANWTDGKNGTHVSTCANDSCEATKSEPHAFETYIYQEDAKCGVDGTEVATCAKCGATDTRTAAGTALQHAANPDVPGKITDPTCTEPGYTTFMCSRCGQEFDADFVDPLGHTPNLEYEPIVTASTCAAEGFTTYACARCGAVYRDDFVPMSGHKAVSEADKAATCTEAGYKGGSHCSVCGETLSSRTPIPALGHSFGAWNASGGGNHTASCARCGATKTEACGYSEVRVGAVTMQVCKVCGDVIDPTGGEAATAGRFEVVAEATSEELDPGAIPSGCELIVRKLDVPFQEEQEVLEAFTIGCEQNGVAMPLQGRIRVTMPVSCPMPFRLIRVDVIEDAQSGETTEQRVEIEFTYESGRITFETDRDGMFLLTELDEEIR